MAVQPLPGKALHCYVDIPEHSLPGDMIRVYLYNLSQTITGTNPPTHSVSVMPTTTDQQLVVGSGYIRSIRIGGTGGVNQGIVLYDTAAGPGGTEIWHMDAENGVESIEFTVGIPFSSGIYVDFRTVNDTSIYLEWSETPGTAIYPASGNATIIQSDATALSDAQLHVGAITVKRITLTAPGNSASTFACTLYDTAAGPGGTGVIKFDLTATKLTQYFQAGLRFSSGIYMDVAANAPYAIYLEYDA